MRRALSLLLSVIMAMGFLTNIPIVVNGSSSDTDTVSPVDTSSATASKLTDGDILQLGENCVKKNKTLTFSATVNSMDTLIFRHGKNVGSSGYVAINSTSVEVYNYKTLTISSKHGLNLVGDVEITMYANNSDGLAITITSCDGTYKIPKSSWPVCRGMIELEVVNSDLSDVELAWNCGDAGKGIWVFGDSYLGLSNSARWPYHILKAGYDNALYSGFPGATSEVMYKDWRNVVAYGAPKYAVWCLGMNNGDSSIGVNEYWKACVEAFIADCEAEGIIPILTTIPNTPVINNSFKNEYVKNRGYRYIDFASAVGATEVGSSWYEGMLSSDNVHPATDGAKALAQQVLIDFPEISEEQEPLPTKLHSLFEEIIDTEPECTQNGSKHKECTVCKAILETVEIPAKGHIESDYIIVAGATCTQTGSKHKKCIVCNETVETTEIPANGHNYSEWVIEETQTCVSDGVRAKSCIICGYKIYGTISAEGHTEVTDAEIEATCTETGLTEGSHCSVCNSVIKAQETVAATGHKAGSWKTDKEATVYKAGLKHKECTVCGETVEIGTIKQLKCDKPSLKKIENTADGVKLTWDKVEGADKYEVYYRKGSKGKYTKLGTTSKNYVTHKKAVSGNKYYYYVKAVNEAGASSASKSKSKYYLADPTLKTPKSTKSGVTLKWSKITGADGYMVYRKTGSGSYSKIATVKGNSKVTYTDKKAKKGKKYTYKIKAYYSKTYSVYSNTKTIKDKY